MRERSSESPEQPLEQYFAADIEAAQFIAAMIRNHFGNDLPATLTTLAHLEKARLESLEGDLINGWRIMLIASALDDIDGDMVELGVHDLDGQYLDTVQRFETFYLSVPKSLLKQSQCRRPNKTDQWINAQLTALQKTFHQFVRDLQVTLIG